MKKILLSVGVMVISLFGFIGFNQMSLAAPAGPEIVRVDGVLRNARVLKFYIPTITSGNLPLQAIYVRSEDQATFDYSWGADRISQTNTDTFQVEFDAQYYLDYVDNDSNIGKYLYFYAVYNDGSESQRIPVRIDDRELATEKENAKNQISNLENLTHPQIEDFLTQVNNQTSTPEVEQILNTALLQDAKQGANNQLQSNANTEKAAIDQLPGLTSEQKAALKDQIDQILQTGLTAINNATTSAAAQQALQDATNQINQIVANAQLQNSKNQASDQLKNHANNQKAAIDQLPGLTNEQKTALKNQVDQILQTGLTAINNATTPAAVQQALQDAINRMNQVKPSDPLQASKDQASSQLQNQAAQQKAAIDQMPGLTGEQKAALKNQIDQILQAGLTAINGATTPTAVQQALQGATNQINQVGANAQLQNSKNLASEQLKNHAAKQKAAIDQMPGLTSEQKAALKNQIDQILQAGLTAINDATTPTAVQQALEEAIDQMNQVMLDPQLQSINSQANQNGNGRANLNAQFPKTNENTQETKVLKVWGGLLITIIIGGAAIKYRRKNLFV
ncbi:DUF1542 domain-containing protein [Enterococcus faecalis]